ncbi:MULTISPECIES: hypothetical protein [unclassified Streptomyces]
MRGSAVAATVAGCLLLGGCAAVDLPPVPEWGSGRTARRTR